MTQNRIIGLIGGSGVGKTTFCTVAKDLGYTIIDGDKIGHDVLQKEAFCELVSEFGEGIVEGGTISRKRLGGIVFADKERLEALNKIVHRHIEDKICGLLTEKCVIDAAVLHKTSLIKKCTHIISVVAPKEKQLERIIARDGISCEKAAERLNAQPSDEEYIKLSDIVLNNGGSTEDFIKAVRECLLGL